MKNLAGTISAILILLSVCAQATTMDFYTDGTIVDGNNFDQVNTWNSAIVNMSGGEVLYFYTYQTSKVNFGGGDVTRFFIQGESQLNISGGWIHGSLSVGGSSIVNLTGGKTHGSIIKARDFSIVNIYGTSLCFSGSYIDGYWDNGLMFSIVYDNDSYSHIVLHEIPEPATLLLLTLGGFLLKNNK